MKFLTINRVSGLSLMVGVLLWFATSVLTPGAITSSEEGQFFEGQLRAWMENGPLTHVMTMVTMLSAGLLAFGFYYLLRLGRRAGLSDMALRFGVLVTIFSWMIFIASLGIVHMIVHVLTHGISPDMEESARIDVGLTLYTGYIGVAMGYLALSAIGGFAAGLAIVVRFRGLKHLQFAGYGLVAMAIGQVFNLVLIEHLHDVDFGLLATVSTFLVGLGGISMFIIGYGMFRGHGEFDPESASG